MSRYTSLFFLTVFPALKPSIQNVLLTYFSDHIELYQMFPAEPLHQIEQGVGGKHIWPWIKTKYLTAHELAVLDQKWVLAHIFV